MTEPTWKDPLLAKWWEGCSEETRARMQHSDRTMTPMNAYYSAALQLRSDDVDRLFALIDAELALGRRARAAAEEMAKRWAIEDNSPAYAVARTILEAFDDK